MKEIYDSKEYMYVLITISILKEWKNLIIKKHQAQENARLQFHNFQLPCTYSIKNIYKGNMREFSIKYSNLDKKKNKWITGEV